MLRSLVKSAPEVTAAQEPLPLVPQLERNFLTDSCYALITFLSYYNPILPTISTLHGVVLFEIEER